MIQKFMIIISWSLFHEYEFGHRVVEKCVLDIKLLNRPTMHDGYREYDAADSGSFDNGAKSVSKVEPKNLA